MRFIGSTAPTSAFAPVQRVMDMMQKDFGFPLKDRMAVIPEVDMFRIKEDESIYEQVRTEKYDYHVLFDGEFVCFFNVDDHPQRIRIRILQGLKDLYKAGKIFWDQKRYQEQVDMKKALLASERDSIASRAKQATTSEEKMVHEAIKRAVISKK